MKKKLIAALACRNFSHRLYGKPLQNLDANKNVTILDYLIRKLKKIKVLDEILLGIAEGDENLIYRKIAEKHKIKFIIGDEKDVLSRIIKCAQISKATDVLRITSESPFPFLENIELVWKEHAKHNLDGSFLDNIIDGCGYEILSTKALINSHKNGKNKHRSELCTLYIRENIKKFNIRRIIVSKKYFRKDIRLTVDYPEDLIVCRAVYNFLKSKRHHFNLSQVINFIDKKKELKTLIKKYTNSGYKSMYKWIEK